MRPNAVVAKGVSIAVLCFVLQTSTTAAQVMYMVGNISGTVNGTAVDFDLNIKLNMKTGEETARVGNMDPEMGAILRQVPAMVTIGGPTGGATPRGGQNLFKLSGGNFVNRATVYWPRTGDKLELIHTVSYSGGNTMNVSATMNGTGSNHRGPSTGGFQRLHGNHVLGWSRAQSARCQGGAGCDNRGWVQG